MMLIVLLLVASPATGKSARIASLRPGDTFLVNGTDLGCLVQRVNRRSLLCLRSTARGVIRRSYAGWLDERGGIIISRAVAKGQLRAVFARGLTSAVRPRTSLSRNVYTLDAGDVVRVRDSGLGCRITGRGNAKRVQCAARVDSAGVGLGQTYGIELTASGKVTALRYTAARIPRSIFTRSSSASGGSVVHLNIGDSIETASGRVLCGVAKATQGDRTWPLVHCGPSFRNGNPPPGSQAFLLDERDTVGVVQFGADGASRRVFQRAPNVRGEFTITYPSGRHITVDRGDDIRIVGGDLTCSVRRDTELRLEYVRCARADARGQGIPRSHGAVIYEPGVVQVVRFGAERQPRLLFPTP